MRTLRSKLRGFVQGIKNLIRWFPLIWKDKDWDHWFLEEMMIQKLNNMADFFEDPLLARTHDATYRGKQMRIAADLLRLCQKQYYSDEYFDYYSQDFYLDEFGHLQFQEETIYDNLDEYFNKYSRVKKGLLNGSIKTKISHIRKDRMRMAMAIADYNHNRARRIAYHILDSQSPSWWD